MEKLQFTNFKSFLNAIQSITQEDLEEAKRILETNGKDIESIEDIYVNHNKELFELLPDGTLIRVNLYIATQIADSYANFNTFDANDIRYKYHIYQCGAISMMFNSNKKHRYKLNTRRDATFYFTFMDSKDRILGINENQKITICEKCRKKFISNFLYKDKYTFKLEDFYKKGNSFFHGIDMSAIEKHQKIKNTLITVLWNKISRQMALSKNYTCEQCGLSYQEENHKIFFAPHIINGNKQNNYEDKLELLCIKCHSEIDLSHAIIKQTFLYDKFKQSILYEQNTTYEVQNISDESIKINQDILISNKTLKDKELQNKLIVQEEVKQIRESYKLEKQKILKTKIPLNIPTDVTII